MSAARTLDVPDRDKDTQARREPVHATPLDRRGRKLVAAPFASGSAIPSYEFVGAEGAPVILALGGISANRHVVSHASDDTPGWWEGLTGTGRPFDLQRSRVLGLDYVDGGRAPGGRPRDVVSTHDQARRIISLLDALCIERVDAVVGASYGGMVALALAERWAERVD